VKLRISFVRFAGLLPAPPGALGAEDAKKANEKGCFTALRTSINNAASTSVVDKASPLRTWFAVACAHLLYASVCRHFERQFWKPKTLVLLWNFKRDNPSYGSNRPPRLLNEKEQSLKMRTRICETFLACINLLNCQDQVFSGKTSTELRSDLSSEIQATKQLAAF